MSFVPLQVTGTYSLLQSPIRPTDLVEAAKKRGYDAVAMTDINVMYGTVKFFHAAKRAGIKPILGLQLGVAINDVDNHSLPLILLAQDQLGYRNLMLLSSLMQTRDNDQPVDLSQVLPFAKGLFIIIAASNNVGLACGPEAKVDLLRQLAEAIDPGNLLQAINPYCSAVLRTTLAEIAQRYRIPLVGVTDVRYLDPGDVFATKVLQAIDSGETITDPLGASQKRGLHYLRTAQEEMKAYQRAGLTAAAEKTSEVAKACQATVELKSPVLPHFHNEQGLTSADYLRQLCQAGLKKRPLAPGKTKKDYQQRLEYELKTIHELGFDDYFLIEWDVMRFAHQQKITTGPGRGSASGSLVAYALAITEVDPLEYNLLFERFLNPERKQMPDIDLDLPDNRRQEVLQYLHQKYGHKRMAQIITFGTEKTKQVIRDVARVFGLPQYSQSDWSAAIPRVHNITLKQSYDQSQRFRNLVADSRLNQLLYKTACQLEGLPRNRSTHAAGIVLAEEPLRKTVSLETGSDGMLMTQYDKNAVEEVGLLKMDFLGLRNLTIVDNTIRQVRRKHPDFDLNAINLNDPGVLKMFQQGETSGVFQFESSGIRQVLVAMHPDSFDDIVAVIALYRPGPMENISHYIARKKGQEKVTLPDSRLAPILGPTYGILVYQEQVMQVASVMAGFSMGEADLLRRAMSKKKQATMDQMRTKFIQGAEANGTDHGTASQVFDYIDQFANYGFNHSHAVAYAKLSFEIAYLKLYAAPAFFTSLMADTSNTAKLRSYVIAARNQGVKVAGPRINHSELNFHLAGKVIYFGLANIKGMRRDFATAIIQERTDHGAFRDLPEFLSRIAAQWRKADPIKALILAGCFDGLGYNRKEMVTALPDLINGADLGLGHLDLGDASLNTTIPQTAEFSLAERLQQEQDALGVYLSGHPTDQYHQLATKVHAVPVRDLRDNSQVTMILYVMKVKRIMTRKNPRRMAFVTASDATGSIDLTVFPQQYERYEELLNHSLVIVVTGKVENRNRGRQLVVKQMQSAQALNRQLVTHIIDRWAVQVVNKLSAGDVNRVLTKLAGVHPGHARVIVYYPKKNQQFLQPRQQSLATDESTRAALIDAFGSANVLLQHLQEK